MSGSNFILGDVHFETVVKCSGCTTGSTGRVRGADGTGGVVDVNATLVGDAADECDRTSFDAAQEPCTVGDYKKSLSALASPTADPNVRRLTGAPGQNVVCVSEVKVGKGKKIQLAGDMTTFFIINVAIRGEFTIDDGKIVAVAPVEPKDVLYNVLGAGPKVSFTGGSGGVGCCSASIDGTLLAIDREIALSPGLINGQLCSDAKVSLDGGSGVHCPNPQP
jgi:putative adhesin